MSMRELRAHRLITIVTPAKAVHILGLSMRGLVPSPLRVLRRGERVREASISLMMSQRVEQPAPSHCTVRQSLPYRFSDLSQVSFEKKPLRFCSSKPRVVADRRIAASQTATMHRAPH